MASKAPKEKKLKMDRRNINQRARIQKQSATIKRIGTLVGAEERSSQQKIMDTAKQAITRLNNEEKIMAEEIMGMDQTIFHLQQKLAFLESGPMMLPPPPPVEPPMYGGFVQPQHSFDDPGHQAQLSSSCANDFIEDSHEDNDEFFELEEEYLDEESDEFMAGTSDSLGVPVDGGLFVNQPRSSDMLVPMPQGYLGNTWIGHQQQPLQHLPQEANYVNQLQYSEQQQYNNHLNVAFQGSHSENQSSFTNY